MDLYRHYVTQGIYTPSFFFMKLNVSLNFADNFVCGNIQNMAVFLHEYIHYLQDVSTTYGYLQIHSSIEHLVGYLHYAQNSGGNSLKRIVLNDDSAIRIKDFVDYTSGDCDDWTYDIYDSIEIISVKPAWSINEIHLMSSGSEEENYWKSCTVPKLSLRLTKSHSSDLKEFNFGASAISESMARLIERHIYYSKKNISLQVQYDIAKLLYVHVMGCDCSEALIVELCVISLMCNNPGAFYYHALLSMKQSDFHPKKIGDIFFFTQKNASPYSHILRKNFFAARQSIKAILPKGKDGFGKLQDYTIEVLKKGMQNRIDRFDFIYKIMSLPICKALDYWRSLTYDFHFPLIITNNNECFGGMDGEKYNEIFYVAYNVLNNILYKNGSTHCNLINICKTNPEIVTDEHCICKVDPWNKLLSGNLCPLAVLWKMWQLDEKYIDY